MQIIILSVLHDQNQLHLTKYCIYIIHLHKVNVSQHIGGTTFQPSQRQTIYTTMLCEVMWTYGRCPLKYISVKSIGSVHTVPVNVMYYYFVYSTRTE